MKTANRPSVQAVVRHAISDNAEYLLCGLALDCEEDGPMPVPTKPGETVTCINCREVLDHIRKTFHGYRHVPNARLDRQEESR
jgi:hypothetical protein